MSRRWLLSLLCLALALFALFFVQRSKANSALSVNESATRFLIQDEAIVKLTVANPLTRQLTAQLRLELLDTKDLPRGIAIRELALQPGTNELAIPLSLTADRLNQDDDNQLPWYRLRYLISPAAANGPDGATGIISLSEIDTPDIFALEVSAPRETHRGARHFTHIRAFHPLSSQPVKDVKVSVELQLDDNPVTTIKGSGVTDATGYALVRLNIPSQLKTDEGELTVVARHGGYVKKTSNDIDLTDQAQIMITTDKPIYQPGQQLHVRALVFDAAKHAAANAAATLKITDPENTNVFQTTLQTSRFGVASGDWTIPENTRLGDYSISVDLDDENYGDSQAYQVVKISRYDLPNFSVTVKPDRSYYLPAQNAQINVSADYLFGQPVKRGHVRVVREEEREWNYRAQKWDIKAGEVYEGETNDQGHFLAQVDLGQAHKTLADEDYSRFQDLHYAAYFTDPTTNRTEQRRFDLRVSKEAIHVYISAGQYRQAHTLPLEFFLATSYADGTPAPCEVTISESPDDYDDPRPAAPVAVQTIRTNKYGIAKVAGLILPGTAHNQTSSLVFTARSSNGMGQHTESFYKSEEPVIRVATDKSLYRPGDPIKVNIIASAPDLNTIVDISREGNIIASQSLSLRNGAATILLPYRPEFQDEITITAYSRTGDHYSYDIPFGSRTVLFPRDRDLKLNFHFDHTDYRPGTDATVNFRVTTPDGRPADSALGVVVFDRAVEERARTDQEFSGGFGFYRSFSRWRGYDDQIGGITRKDLQRIDLSRPLPEETELVAELLLGAGNYQPEFFSAEGFETDHASIFSGLTALLMKPIGDVLETRYKNGGSYPTNSETLRRLLLESGWHFAELRDPWGTPYRAVFSVERDDDVLEIMSAGPDKIFATKDDFSASRITTPYFRFTGEAISRAVERFHARCGGFIRDPATLKSELRTEGIDFDSLRDRWDQPYELGFTIIQNRFNLTVRSSGPNKVWDGSSEKSDDFTIWIASIDYLRETRALMERALADYFKELNDLPRNESQLQRAFAAAAIASDQRHDPWSQSYYGVYKTEARFADRTDVQNVAAYGGQARQRIEITPVTQQVASVVLRSSGPDGKQGTADDFDVAVFSQLTGEVSSRGETVASPLSQVFFGGGKGAIKGTVTDPVGAVVPNVTVTATLTNSATKFTSVTDDNGRFILKNLPVGLYEVRCDANGFKSALVIDVPVSSSNITTTDFILEAGTVSEVVTVTAGSDNSINTMSSQVAGSSVAEVRTRVSVGQSVQLATPRLREYFPETLVWQPSLETDSDGRAQLKFKLADNITTWKMSVIGSTADGALGSAETEIKAFQPFFLEHDPPRILTEGDQISLPVVLRNYLERAQTVDLEIKPESWFSLQGPAQQRASVPAGDAARQTFQFQAVAPVKDGKQRITARGAEASDAIEKPVTVHPDGEEKTQTASDVLGNAVTLEMSLPTSAISGSTQAELKVYPDLMTHVVESVEGILERPHGCGEQTISSTYPSLLVLRRDKQLGSNSRIGNTAKRYAALGYQRLLTYRTEDGGFSYWGRGAADLALTAYALRFLHDAAEFLPVDEDLVKQARQWLGKQQRGDGTWGSTTASTAAEKHQSALLTAYVARVLAMTENQTRSSNGKQPAMPSVSPELQRALAYLATNSDAIDEPYLLAQYALAAIDVGDRLVAMRATARLRTLAHSEGDTVYWALETNTPFYGWGLAGRVETSALAIQALARQAQQQAGATTMGAPADDPVIRKGLLFLLRQKDRYGVWYSTQATINVLDTLMALLTSDGKPGAATLEVFINGQLASTLNLPAGEQTAGLMRVDVSRFLSPGANRVELRRPTGAAFASVQLVANYYLPWTTATANPDAALKTTGTGALRLDATFTKHEARINEDIVCHVKAERVGFRGYGMMLAEIGLPPGAEVDRASLETAMKNSGWSLNHYDVLPDRVVFYLWARAGGTEFEFKFRPRFAMHAKSAASVVYDYYNPEARAVVLPATFVVR